MAHIYRTYVDASFRKCKLSSFYPKHCARRSVDLFRSAFQSSNSIGQFIIHDYIGIRAVALTRP